jgi:hypothetical protein
MLTLRASVELRGKNLRCGFVLNLAVWLPESAGLR